MLRVTFTGQSGWLVEANGSRILVDPILRDCLGTSVNQFTYPPNWPPRILLFREFPAIDAVIVSHEHEDHFDLASIAMLDRRIAVYLSGRSSVAASAILEEMGFKVSLLEAGSSCRIGALELLPLSPDHAKMSNSDEWDCFGLFVRNADEGGSFFTSVDIVPTGEMLRRIRELVSGGWLLSFRDGWLHWSHHAYLEQVLFRGSPAEAIVGTAGIEEFLRNEDALRILPGHSFVVTANQILKAEERSPFVSTRCDMRRPDPPKYRFPPLSEDYTPITERKKLTDQELAEIVEHLSKFAEFLYGGGLFRKLLSLSSEVLGKKKPSLLILLIADESREYISFEYDIRSCGFEAVHPDNPISEYVCGIECWATDLLAVLRGDVNPRVLLMGHSRHWTSGKIAPNPFIAALVPFLHPLRHPWTRLAKYREIVKNLDSDARILFQDSIDQER